MNTQLLEKLVSASKFFHSYIRRKKDCPSIGPLRSEYGRVVSDASDMNELPADAFSAVFVESAPPVPAQHQRFAGVLDEVYLSSGSIARVLTGLNSSSAAGPDGLHPHLLRVCSAAFSLPFYILFVTSLHEGVLPSLWKTSIVAPLHKIGSRCDSLNYRPASFTSVCCTVLERVIVTQLMDYLELNTLLSVHQLGFRESRRVEVQLLVTYGEVVELVDKGFCC